MPILSFFTNSAWVWIRAVVRGAVVGIYGSTWRATVADIVPGTHLGTAYGIFTAAYGLVCSTVIGALYDYTIAETVYFTVAIQVVALGPFLPLAAQRSVL